ncbi:MAG: SSI family serine proteinase inhibitor [Micromonosporaceae bacterium]
MTGAAAVAAAVTALLLISACGSQHAGGSGSSNSSPSGSAKPSSSLTIQVRTSPQAAAHTWTLTCGPTGGSLPGASAACATLARVKEPFAPVKRGVMCSMIYSGPQTATIEGTWQGTPVHASFSRVNGCETRRWTMIAPVFGPYASPSAT